MTLGVGPYPLPAEVTPIESKIARLSILTISGSFALGLKVLSEG